MNFESARKPAFPVRFGSFTCSQPRHVGSMFDEDRNTLGPHVASCCVRESRLQLRNGVAYDRACCRHTTRAKQCARNSYYSTPSIVVAGFSHLAAAGCSHARDERLGMLLVDEVEGGARAHIRLEPYCWGFRSGFSGGKGFGWGFGRVPACF